MKRKERTKYLIACGRDEALAWTQKLEGTYDVETISPVRQALTMIKVRESAQNTSFYMGEVLVTEAKVRIQGKVGLGLLAGHDPDFAKSLAMIDAAYRANLPECASMDSLLHDLRHRYQKEADQKRDALAKTQVDFSTMQV